MEGDPRKREAERGGGGASQKLIWRQKGEGKAPPPDQTERSLPEGTYGSTWNSNPGSLWHPRAQYFVLPFRPGRGQVGSKLFSTIHFFEGSRMTKTPNLNRHSFSNNLREKLLNNGGTSAKRKEHSLYSRARVCERGSKPLGKGADTPPPCARAQSTKIKRRFPRRPNIF